MIVREASLRRRLMDAPSIGHKPMEKQLAIEDRPVMLGNVQQLAIEDALPGLSSDGLNGKSSPHGHDGLKSDGSKTSPHGQDGLKSDGSKTSSHGQDGLKSSESKSEPPPGQNELKSSVPGGQDGLQSEAETSLRGQDGVRILAIQDHMVKRGNDPGQVEIEEPAKNKKKKKKTFASRCPNALQSGLKWDAIRSAFAKHIYPKVYSPSTVEDGFYKMRMARLDHMNYESMHSAEAELCSFVWLKIWAMVF